MDLRNSLETCYNKMQLPDEKPRVFDTGAWNSKSPNPPNPRVVPGFLQCITWQVQRFLHVLHAYDTALCMHYMQTYDGR